MTTTYTVTVTCSATTVTALLNQGNALVAFSAVQGSDATALPLVWMTTTGYSTSYTLTWSTLYQAYTSTATTIGSGTMVPVSHVAKIATGQTANVALGALITVASGGLPGAVVIANTTSTQYSCGIQQNVNNAYAPVCAYPLYGHNAQVITPLPQIVLMFTTAPLQVGEAWSGGGSAPSFGLELFVVSGAALIDMSSQTSLTVSYDVNAGWSSASASLTTIGLSQLVRSLIQPDPAPAPRGAFR